MNPFYTDYSEYLGRIFPGRKVQKISVNLGNGCPNRDGTIGTGGCIYCNNRSFTPAYCFEGGSVSDQIEAGKRFFSRKYPEMEFLVYFQSYTGTYGQSATGLEHVCRQALAHDRIAGLVIGTRPDCLPRETVETLAAINVEKPVFVELGVESLHDRTLRLLNRGHDSRTSRDAICRLADSGLHVGAHLIAGLPGETDEDFFATVGEISRLSVETLKFHHLQVLKGTRLAGMIADGKLEVPRLGLEEYLEICVELVKRVPRRIAIERFLASAPPEMVLSPKWGLKNHEFIDLLHRRLAKKDFAGR